MSLIIKSLKETAPEGAKKLYRDALVSEGSLILVDFSNRGTTDNFSVNGGDQFYNLAREASEPLGVEMDGYIFRYQGGSGSLSEGKGVNLYEWIGADEFRFGKSVTDYLHQNQPHSVMTMWVRVHEIERSIGNRILGVTTTNNTSFHTGSIGSILSASQPTLSFGGASISAANYAYIKGDLVQLAVEFNGVGQAGRIFVNGQLVGDTIVTDGFTGDIEKFSINGGVGISNPTDAAVYRVLIEDLSVSGRNADEVVKKDWDYVNATGEYEGIPKRPFVDTF